jgi:uncharacterized protein YyaL (SSP411 family)
MTDQALAARPQDDSTGQNRLGAETSPYLLQHKDNPVAWRAWGPEALSEAKRTGKPILLSVGYAACHWCHVMAHESFEDETTAQVMNELFINIKVDREERPDVDAIYMAALHELGEQGGWPLTMFLTSDAEPFWGGTYFPKFPRFGRPAFVDVLREVARLYREEPHKVRQNADLLRGRLQPRPSRAGPNGPSDASLAELARSMLRVVDPTHGGVRGAPKFPQAQIFGFLWRAGLRYGLQGPREAAALTLTHLCQGGIYDHVGGGFARYATDERWLVPHFEKMLYDNALIVDLLTEVWRETKSKLFEARVRETVAWLLREMVTEGGGFASSLDADSEGEEGKFYVWNLREIEEVLGPRDTGLFAEVYDVTPEGNWEGHTILNRLKVLDLREKETERRLAVMRAKLFERRSRRVRPGFDDKVLADWNGLMIAALAKSADAFGEKCWLEAAQRAFDFIRTQMNMCGRLAHAWRAGEAKAPATAGDYANMIRAALALANVTGDTAYVAHAAGWSDTLGKHYWSETLAGYHLAADDTRDLILRPFSTIDEATPNANAVMVSNLMALYLWTSEEGTRERADRMLYAFAGTVAENVLAHAGVLGATMDVLAPALIVLVVPEGLDARSLRAALRDISLPGAVVQEVTAGAALLPSSPAYGKRADGGKPTAYVCMGPHCEAPVTEPAALVEVVKAARRALPGAQLSS